MEANTFWDGLSVRGSQGVIYSENTGDLSAALAIFLKDRSILQASGGLKRQSNLHEVEEECVLQNI